MNSHSNSGESVQENLFRIGQNADYCVSRLYCAIFCLVWDGWPNVYCAITKLYYRVGWFTYIVYMSDWVGEGIYKGNPTAPEGDPDRTNYDVCILFYVNV